MGNFNIVGSSSVKGSNGVPPGSPSSVGAGGKSKGRNDSAIVGLKAQPLAQGTRGRDIGVLNSIKARG